MVKVYKTALPQGISENRYETERWFWVEYSGVIHGPFLSEQAATEDMNRGK